MTERTETHPDRHVRGLADELAANPVLGDLREDFLELIAGCCVNVGVRPGRARHLRR